MVILTTTQPSYLHNLITVQPPRSTRSSSLVTLTGPSTSSSLGITDRSFQYASPHLGINCEHLYVNHAVISPILTHLIRWVALPPSVPSTHNSHHPSPLTLSFQAWNLTFLQILSTLAFLFFFRTDSTDSPDCLQIILSISVFHLNFFCFYTFYFLLPCGWLRWLMSAFERKLNTTLCPMVSYETFYLLYLCYRFFVIGC